MERDLLPSLIRRSTAWETRGEEDRQVRTRADVGAGIAPISASARPTQKPSTRFEKFVVESAPPSETQTTMTAAATEQKKEKWMEKESPAERPVGRITRNEFVTEIQQFTIPIKTVIVEEPPEQVFLPAKHIFEDKELSEFTKDLKSTRELPPVTLPPVEKKIILKRRLFIQPIVHHSHEINEIESQTKEESKEILEGPYFDVLPLEERWLPNLHEERHEFVKDRVELEKQLFTTRINKTNTTLLETSHLKKSQPGSTETESKAEQAMGVSSSEEELYKATVQREEFKEQKKKKKKKEEKASKSSSEHSKHSSDNQQPSSTERRTSIEQESPITSEPPHGMTLSDIAS